MTIELNLVFSQGIYASIFTLLARKRAQVENSDETMAAILSFMNENTDLLHEVLSDEDLINRINSAEYLTINDFMSIKYLLASSGIDVLVYEVAEMEQNPESIPSNQDEYMIISDLQVTYGVKLASKFLVEKDNISLVEVYRKAIEVGNFFSNEITAGYKNPLLSALNTLEQSEKILGNTPSGLTTSIESMLKYLGISLVVITNQ